MVVNGVKSSALRCCVLREPKSHHHIQEKSCTKIKRKELSLSPSLPPSLPPFLSPSLPLSLSPSLSLFVWLLGYNSIFPLCSSSPKCDVSVHFLFLLRAASLGIKSYRIFSSLVCLLIHSHEQPCIRHFVPDRCSCRDMCKHFLDSLVSSTFTSFFSCKSCTTHWQSISCLKAVRKIAGQKQILLSWFSKIFIILKNRGASLARSKNS